MKNVSFAALIVTYNRKELLKKAIESLLDQSYPVRKIVVVDNNSSDGTFEMINTNGYLKLKNFHYIRLNENTGGSGGFCVGLDYLMKDSEIEWIALSDDDFIYDKDFFHNIATFINNPPEENVVAVTGTVIENGKIAYFTRRILKDKVFFRQAVVDKNLYLKDFFEYNLLSFAGCVIRKAAIAEVGLPEKRYFIYYDDTEFSLRLSSLGKIFNYNKAFGYHLVVSKNGFLNIDWKYYYGFRNFVHMAMKHSRFKLLTFLYLTFNVIKQVLAFSIKKRYKGSRKYIIKMLLTAYLHGLSGKLGVNRDYYPR